MIGSATLLTPLEVLVLEHQGRVKHYTPAKDPPIRYEGPEGGLRAFIPGPELAWFGEVYKLVYFHRKSHYLRRSRFEECFATLRQTELAYGRALVEEQKARDARNLFRQDLLQRGIVGFTVKWAVGVRDGHYLLDYREYSVDSTMIHLVPAYAATHFPEKYPELEAPYLILQRRALRARARVDMLYNLLSGLVLRCYGTGVSRVEINGRT